MASGTDLVSFFNPAFFGQQSEAEIVVYFEREGLSAWSLIFDSLNGAGIKGIELTFSPFDPQSAVRAHGGEAALKKVLDASGLEIWSCFFVDLDRIPVAEYGAQREHILERVRLTCRFLSNMGGKVLVVGLPCRSTRLAEPVKFVDVAFAAPIADLLNHMGACAAAEGISLALHTESNSVFCAPRDVDLFMLLTDPAYVGFCPDPAHITIAGGDPVRLVGRHIERVVAMHWKDAQGLIPADTVIDETIHAKHRPYFRGLGEGAVDFDALAALLRDAPLRCGPILELDACPDPVPMLRRGAAFVAARTSDAR